MNKHKRVFPTCRHAELVSASSRSNNQSGEIPNQVWNDIYFGFTLIEVLVVVLIIAVLAAIAVPQYQKAVLKSRFSSLMPITKAIRDGNEAYFLGNGQYSNVLADLDITTQSGEETTVELSDDDDYAYVLSHRSDNPKNNLIMYQAHSANYPGEIHCEALEEDEQANWLCETGMNATQNIGTVITSGYTTYVLEGTGAGLPPGSDDDTMSCDKALSMGFTCTMNESGTEKQICKDGFCRTKTYNEDGSYTSVTCVANSEGVCTSGWKSVTYDANGNKTSQRTCSTVAADGSCSYSYGLEYTYDANGNMTSQRYCQPFASDGSCSKYTSYGNYDYTYDANGNKTSQRNCNTVAADGSCSRYESYGNYDYTYDANGNQTRERDCQTVAADGSCSAYSSSRSDSTYDANGNETSWRRCSTVAADGSCSTYSSGYDYTYDANGNKTRERRCSTVAADGSCSAYSSGTDYTYDANGKLTSERDCQTVASDGSCSAYGGDGYYYTYDANGNQTSQRHCGTVASDGSCAAYSQGIDYTYDEEGKQIAGQYCFDAHVNDGNVNKATGECIRYISTDISAN